MTKPNINASIEDDIKQKSQNNDSDLSKLSELLLDEKFRRRKTILTDRQIAKITTIDVVSQIYDIQFLKDWVLTFGEFRTSGRGQGRQDIVDIAKFNYKQQKDFQNELFALMGRR